ncbi:hypothetical protein [Streptomyces sp. NPDC058424]|uniref:hypothetical protein n=1 Tax=Streptomyces sp. NPDC058424 TaxID=3346491 RepID=UPI00365A775C
MTDAANTPSATRASRVISIGAVVIGVAYTGLWAYYCLGAPLAKMEADLALRGLFDAFPDLELTVPAGELRPQESFIVNGHQELPVILAKPARTPSAPG